MVNTSSPAPKPRWGLWIVLVVVATIALIGALAVIAKQVNYNLSNNSNNLQAMSTTGNDGATPSDGDSGTAAGADKNDSAETGSQTANVKERMLGMTIHAEPCEMSEGSLDRGFVRYGNLPADLRDSAYPPHGHIRVQKGDTAADQIYAVEVDSQHDGRPEYLVVMECWLGGVSWPQQLIVLDENLNQTDFVSVDHYPTDAELARVGLRDLQTRGDKVYMMWDVQRSSEPACCPTGRAEGTWTITNGKFEVDNYSVYAKPNLEQDTAPGPITMDYRDDHDYYWGLP